jgi:uncharacterized protein
MDKTLNHKYDQLKKIVLDAEKVIVAFSGGVDSTFLLKVCVDLLGEDALAVTARSKTFPIHELEQTKKLVARMNAKHIIFDSHELQDPDFSSNPPNRCFFCKTELFTKAKEIALKHGITQIFDGNNTDDAGDFRPGRTAARQLGVRSPLEEAGLNKNHIRVLSKALDLPTWDKPAFACLSSRFPYHTKITEHGLLQVEKAEDFLRQMGLKVFRVRHHDNIARIEMGKDDMNLLWESDSMDRIVKYFKSLGYQYVTMDLQGYRTGSMNETLNINRDKGSKEKQTP